MESKFRPPWLLYSFGWLSMGWKCGSAEEDRFKFEKWYLSLTTQDKDGFKSKFQESKWWPGYYFYIENIMKKDRGGIVLSEFMKDFKDNQKKYAEKLYAKAIELENSSDYKSASDLYIEIGRNFGPYNDSSERYELIRTNHQ